MSDIFFLIFAASAPGTTDERARVFTNMAESQFDDEDEGGTGASLTYLDIDYDGADTQVRLAVWNPAPPKLLPARGSVPTFRPRGARGVRERKRARA